MQFTGKRRARSYVCKALNFGLETGYLKQADKQGNLLRVSSALVANNEPRDTSREKRRNMRRKDENSDRSMRRNSRRSPGRQTRNERYSSSWRRYEAQNSVNPDEGGKKIDGESKKLENDSKKIENETKKVTNGKSDDQEKQEARFVLFFHNFEFFKTCWPWYIRLQNN